MLAFGAALDITIMNPWSSSGASSFFVMVQNGTIRMTDATGIQQQAGHVSMTAWSRRS